jgi:hypothetical protein
LVPVASAAPFPESPLVLLPEVVFDPPSVSVPVLRGAGPGSVVPEGCVPDPVVGVPLLLGVSPLETGGSSTPPPATGPLGPVEPVPPVAPVAPVSPVGSTIGSSAVGDCFVSTALVCGDAAERLDFLDEDLVDVDFDLVEDFEDEDELDEDPLSLLAAAGAAGSTTGAGSGAGAGATSTGVETASDAPEPATAPLSSPEANAGTVAGITSNRQKIRIVAIFDR